MKKGVIFDLDGTLVNSIPHFFSIHQEVLKETIGFHLTKEYFYQYCNGRSAKEFYASIVSQEKLPTTKINMMMHLDKKLALHGPPTIKVFPHVKSILKELVKTDARIALATSSSKSYAKQVLKFNEIEDYFNVIVTRDDVQSTKPDPAIFLLARRKLLLQKKDCVVVEDALNGFKAAKRAGIDCIGLTTSLHKKDIPSYVKVATHKNLVSKILK